MPPFRVQDDVQKWYLKVHKYMRDWIGVKTPGGLDKVVKMISAVPPYEDDSPDPVPYYLRPHANNTDQRRKNLRKQVLASIVSVLQEIVLRQPRVIVGVEQGG